MPWSATFLLEWAWQRWELLDAVKLLAMLVRFDQGEKRFWKVVHVPNARAEDRRHLHRQLWVLKAERTRYRNCIQGLLATPGGSPSHPR